MNLKKNIQFTLYGAIVILVPLLAYLQFTWIGELSRQEKENFKTNFESECHKLSLRISDDFRSISESFFSSINGRDSIKETAGRGVGSLRSGKYSMYVTKIYYYENNGKPTLTAFDEDSNSFIEMDRSITSKNKKLNMILTNRFKYRSPAFIAGDFEFLVFFLFPPNESETAIILELDQNTVMNEIIRKHFSSIFHENLKSRINVFIVNDADSIIFSYDAAAGTIKEAEVIIPIGLILPFRPDEFSRENHSGHPPPPLRKKPAPRYGNSIDKHSIDSRIMPLVLKAGFKPHQLEAMVDDIRYRNLAVSLSILVLLTVVIVLLAINHSRSQALASRQMQFVAGISHELRTPLAVIKSAAQNLSDGIVSTGEKSSSYGKLIQGETDKLWDMIETTLSYAGVQSTSPALQFRKISLLSLLKKSAEYSLGMNNAYNGTIKIDYQGTDVLVNANEQMLLSVFSNIFANSLKYCDKQPEITAKLQLNDNGSRAIVTITDNGPGIPPDELKNITKPFYRGRISTENNIPGNGIGLALAIKAVEFHRGKLKISGSEGMGTEVIIELPIIIS